MSSSNKPTSMPSARTRNCYTRNGTLITDQAYQPCSNDASQDAACCGINHSGVGHTNVANDVCETNGLCQNFEPFDGTNEGAKLWWRQGCTDPTWQSEFCLSQVCDFKLWEGSNAPVRSCGNGKWCCGEKSCCGVTSSLFTLPATIGPTATSSSVSSVATGSVSGSAMAISTTTPASTQSTTNPTSSSTALPATGGEGGLSTGAKAGIGSGAAVVVILIAVIAFLLLKLKRRRPVQEASYMTGPGYVVHGKSSSSVHAYEAPLVEMPAHTHPAELSGMAQAELPDNARDRYHR